MGIVAESTDSWKACDRPRRLRAGRRVPGGGAGRRRRGRRGRARTVFSARRRTSARGLAGQTRGLLVRALPREAAAPAEGSPRSSACAGRPALVHTWGTGATALAHPRAAHRGAGALRSTPGSARSRRVHARVPPGSAARRARRSAPSSGRAVVRGTAVGRGTPRPSGAGSSLSAGRSRRPPGSRHSGT